MADTKISALPASTTPLAGTEVLPIVQSGATKQVSVANLTTGRAISATELTLSTGNLIIGTSGKGIDFSATPGTGTSELLSDYEEGTWTPTLDNVTVVYAFNQAKYVKIGRYVFCSCAISTTSIDNTDNSSFQIGGLPYASADAGYVAGSIGNNGSSAALLTTAVRNMTGVYIAGSLLYLVDASTTTFPTYAGICNASGRVYVSFSYMTA